MTGLGRAELEGVAIDCGLSSESVEFHGLKSDVAGFYHNADVFLLTSDWEGTPNVVLEAMASGLPVVATRVGGLSALIRHGETGYLVDREDESSLADAVLDLAQHREKRIAFGKRAREFVEQHHALPHLAEELGHLYNHVLSPRRRDVVGDHGSSRRVERILIVSHVPHYQHEGRVFAYGPYVREIATWADIFEKVMIAAPCRIGSPPGDCLPLSDGITVIRQPEFGGPDLRAKVKQLLGLPYSIWSLCAAMARTDAIHVRCPGNLGLLGVLLAPIFSRRRIAKYAGQWGYYKGEALSVRLQRALLRSPWWNAPVLAYTDSADEGSNVVPFFTAGLTASQVEQASVVAASRPVCQPRHLLYVGRLSASKNVDVLLNAVATVIAEGLPFTCTIVGEGSERARLERQAVSLGIQNQVHFKGGVAPDEVLPYYQSADSLVLASESEGWPKTITEAMTYGLICVGSNRGLTAQMLADGRGFVVQPRDERSLANVLRRIATMPLNELSAIRDRATDWGRQFTLERFSEELRAVLKSRWPDPDGESQRQERGVEQLRRQVIGVMHLTDTLEVGGAERMAVSLANRLPRSRFAPHICTTRRTGPLADLIAPDVCQFSLDRQLVLDLSALWRLVRYIRRNNIRILHAHGSAVFVSVAASLFRPYPVVVWHIHYGRHAAERARGSLYRFVGRRVKRTIAVSQALEEWATGSLGIAKDRVAYISNFVSSEASAATVADLPGSLGERIVCVANFLPEKDHLTLLRAMALVVRARPSAHLLLVGGGNNLECQRMIRNRIATSGLRENVSMLGQRRDIQNILRASDIGVLSSSAEGLPLALLEYGESALPVVVTSVGQCVEVVDHGNAGICVEPGSASELAENLLRLLRSPDERVSLGQALKNRVRAHYSADAVMESISMTYEHALKDARRTERAQQRTSTMFSAAE